MGWTIVYGLFILWLFGGLCFVFLMLSGVCLGFLFNFGLNMCLLRLFHGFWLIVALTYTFSRVSPLFRGAVCPVRTLNMFFFL